MKTKPFDNLIIIIGSDHHNTLAAIRAFGKENCELRVIIHGCQLVRDRLQVLKCRYVKRSNAYVIEDDAEALLETLKGLVRGDRKGLLFPASDFAEYVIDSNFARLSHDFIAPGYAGAPGKTVEMMDKWNQYLFSQRLGIPMASTYLLPTEDCRIPSELTYPCIVKPRISAMGSKGDIKVCRSEEELRHAVGTYRKLGYADALVQEYLNKKLEANSLGAIIRTKDETRSYGGLAIKLREQLESATSFAFFAAGDHAEDASRFPAAASILAEYGKDGALTEEAYRQLTEVNGAILREMAVQGYSGFYDIDYLLCDGAVYLNEINFRHSGNGYTMTAKKRNAPFWWACEMLGVPCETPPAIPIGSFFMAELLDKMYVKRRQIKLFRWLKDIKRASAFAIFDRTDLAASLGLYCASGLRKIKRLFTGSKGKKTT